MKKLIPVAIGILCLAMIIIISCTKKSDTPANVANTTHPKGMDTITSLASMRGDSVIWSHHGMYTKVVYVESTDSENEGEMEKTGSSCSESYSGSARAAAKTSFVSASYTTYSDVAALRSALPTDATMRSLGIGTSSARVTQENKNVTITTKYLYAITRESDEDYHLVMGTSSVSAGNLLNCEVSGLPSSSQSSYSQIKAQRAVIVAYFGTDFCGKSGYSIFSPGIKLTTLKGSIFYDIDHAPGSVGPAGYKPSTSWEIHPVHDIAF